MHNIIIQVDDITPQGEIRVRILTDDTRLPLFQFECNRAELHVATRQEFTRHLHGRKLPGKLTNRKAP